MGGAPTVGKQGHAVRVTARPQLPGRYIKCGFRTTDAWGAHDYISSHVLALNPAAAAGLTYTFTGHQHPPAATHQTADRHKGSIRGGKSTRHQSGSNLVPSRSLG